MRRLILALFGVMTLAAAARGGDAMVSEQPFTVTVLREPINTLNPIFRAFVTVGDNKFTFIIPEQFSAGGDPTHGRLQLKTLEGDSFITLDFITSASGAGTAFAADTYRQLLTDRYPGATILSESSRPVAGKTGTFFDLTWWSASGFAMKTRAIYFPTAAGVMELTITSGAKKFKAAKGEFDGVLGTFAAGTQGNLVVRHLGQAN